MDYKIIVFFLWWLGMFLFWLSIFEDSIKKLSSKTFRKILKKYTNTNLKALFSWFFATAVLQSTWVVSLIILTFVGIGFISLENAIWVIIWTNLGWPIMDVILWSVWLKFNMEVFSLIFIWLWWFLVTLFWKNFKLKHIFKILFWLWLLFLGLTYIKDNVLLFSETFNFAKYTWFSIYFYFFVGILLTVFMQSSTAMIIIILALAWSNVIDLKIWISMIMWAYIWTTSTAIIWSLFGNYLKKQVAFSHLFFNVFSVFICFIIINYIIYFINNFLWFQDNIILWLWVFVIWFKIFGTILIFPFIKQFTKFIVFIIPERKTRFWLDIERVESGFLDLNIFVMKNDIIRLIKKVFKYNINVFDIDEQKLLNWDVKKKDLKNFHKKFDSEYLDSEYINIKTIEEKIIKYSLDMKNWLKNDWILELNNMYNIIKNLVYSAKYIKDIKFNVQDIQDSESYIINKKYDDFRLTLLSLYKNISKIIDWRNDKEIFNEILDSLSFIKNNYKKFLQSISKDIFNQDLDQLELSGLININRYIYLSCISIIYAVKELFLDEKEKKFFDKMD